MSVLRGPARRADRLSAGFRADVVATAKRDLAAGETLDGEGGTTVYGELVPAPDSIAAGLLPIGLARGVRLVRRIAAGGRLRRADVESLPETRAAQLRRELESRSRRERKSAGRPFTSARPAGSPPPTR